MINFLVIVDAQNLHGQRFLFMQGGKMEKSDETSLSGDKIKIVSISLLSMPNYFSIYMWEYGCEFVLET